MARDHATISTERRISVTPDYYRVGPGDLYEVFRQFFGKEVTEIHLRMEAVQYLLRAGRKGSYRHDLHKAQVILARLLAWDEAALDEERYTPAPMEAGPHSDLSSVHDAWSKKSIDEMAAILRTNGWEVCSAPMPPPLREEQVEMHVLTYPGEPTRDELSVLDHCLAADKLRQGVAVPAEVVELMEHARIPYNGLWADHAAEVARRWPDRWPAIQS